MSCCLIYHGNQLCHQGTRAPGTRWKMERVRVFWDIKFDSCPKSENTTDQSWFWFFKHEKIMSPFLMYYRGGALNQDILKTIGEWDWSLNCHFHNWCLFNHYYAGAITMLNKPMLLLCLTNMLSVLPKLSKLNVKHDSSHSFQKRKILKASEWIYVS